MIWRLLVVLAFAISATVGITMPDRQYRLDGLVCEVDQAVVAHDDSAYTSMTWVASANGDYDQLRFFDKVEGGICLHPSWPELVALHDPRLAHLVPTQEPESEPPQKTWPWSWTPDPGTLSNSAYVRLFPLCLLMNNGLFEAAHGDIQAVQARVLVIGLGSGAGIACLAHHVPGIAITVVDIDHKVVDIVKAHFPLIHWLSTQQRSDGEPRLQFHIGDARRYIQGLGAEPPRFDAVILDAYTAGSTIPPHLMTMEFYHECAQILRPQGIVLSNIIGSYNGEKHRVLGGAMRSFRAAGLVHLVNFPVPRANEVASTVDYANSPRNNIVVCSMVPLRPTGEDDARWARLRAFQAFPELPEKTFYTRSYILLRGSERLYASDFVPRAAIDDAEPALFQRLKLQTDILPSAHQWMLTDQQVVTQARHAVQKWSQKERRAHLPFGWDDDNDADTLIAMETDQVANVRETFRIAVEVAHDIRHHGGEALVGDADFSDPHHAPESAIISDAPLFTDQRPNADILNH